MMTALAILAISFGPIAIVLDRYAHGKWMWDRPDPCDRLTAEKR